MRDSISQDPAMLFCCGVDANPFNSQIGWSTINQPLYLVDLVQESKCDTCCNLQLARIVGHQEILRDEACTSDRGMLETLFDR